MIDTHQTVEELERELVTLPRKIERAAADEDFVSWSELSMRRDAIPEYIRRQRSEPLRAAIARLEAERQKLEEDEQRARDEEPPPVPAHLRGTQTPSGMKQVRIRTAALAGSEVGKELRAKRRELAEIENDVT